MAHLTNNTALITGASRGMGRATALALAGAGARVIVPCGRKAEEANAVADQFRKARGHADPISSDLAKPDGAHALAAQVGLAAGLGKGPRYPCVECGDFDCDKF